MMKMTGRTLASAVKNSSIAALLITTLAVASAGCGSRDKYGLEPEEYEVYRDLFSEALQNKKIITASIPVRAETRSCHFSEEEAIKEMPALQASNIGSFEKRNKRSCNLRGLEKVSPKFRVLSEKEIDDILERCQHRCKGDIWDKCRSRCKEYPGTLFEMSRVGFNTDKTQALIHFGRRSDPVSGSGYLVLLEKENGIWTIKDEMRVWIA